MSLITVLFTSDLAKSVWMGLVRHAAGFIGAGLVSYGVLSPQDASGSVWLGSIMALAAVAWSVYQKWVTTGKAPTI